jgi:plastocyanin
MRLAARLTILVLAAAAGCGGSSTAPSGGGNNNNGNPPPPPPPNNSVTVSNNYFSPATTTVPVGTTVTWTWDSCSGDGYGGQTCVAHTILFDDGPTSGSQSSGTWARTFTTAGTYSYHCSIHGTAMSGTIKVQ